jgi:hypothetical protein
MLGLFQTKSTVCATFFGIPSIVSSVLQLTLQTDRHTLHREYSPFPSSSFPHTMAVQQSAHQNASLLAWLDNLLSFS